MIAVEHDGTPRNPFGLASHEIRTCYERSVDRPKGMSRYEAFAYQIEAEVGRRASAATPGLLPVLRAYARLREHADTLAATLAHGVKIIDEHTPFDVSPGRRVLAAYKREIENED